MQYVLIAIVLMVLCVFGLSCKKSVPTSPEGGQTAGPITLMSGQYLSREDIQKQLAVIAKSPPPKELSFGAMCYEMAAPPSRIDYVCPTCGEKTLYVWDSSADEKTQQQQWDCVWALQELESMRRLAHQMDKLDVTLDESQFCSHCSSGIKGPKFGLIVQYPNASRTCKVQDVCWTDLTMLKAFLDGKLKYKGQQDQESALKDHLPRLEELLGVKLDDTE